MTKPDLKTIYLENCADFSNQHLAKATAAVICSRSSDFSWLQSFEELLPRIKGDQKNPLEVLFEGYHILALALISFLDDTAPQAFRDWVIKKAQEFINAPSWHEFQLLSALKALLAVLSGQTFTPSLPKQLQSGAAFLEWKGYWSWGKIPYGFYHSDLGSLWLIYGYLTQDNLWIEAGKKLAQWQLNVLNSDFLPISSLYMHEDNASLQKMLISNYLLFKVASTLTGDSHLGYAAKRQMDHLNHCQDLHLMEKTVLLESLISRIKLQTNQQPFTLTPSILDEELDLIGLRSENDFVMCTGRGGQTGLGYLNFSGVKVTNYGPQHSPLGDCTGFGIEECDLISDLAFSDTGFFLNSTARIAPKDIDLHSFSNFRNGTPSNIWLNLIQNYTKDERCLQISANFSTLNQLEDLAFVFYIIADTCHIDKDTTIFPKTFTHYRGCNDLLTFTKGNSSLSIQTRGHLNLEVIPLGGGNSFWGADFLVAYRVDSAKTFIWEVSNIS